MIEQDKIYFNAKISKPSKKKSMLDDLDDIDSFTLPSSIYTDIVSGKNESKKQKKEKKSKDDEEAHDDDWLNTIMAFKEPKPKKKRKSMFKGFDVDDTKGEKKSKDGSKSTVTDYSKKFDPELNLYKNMLVDQNKFVDTLQRKYDMMENSKSSARGVGKFTTDLIGALTASRSLSVQLVDKIVNTKKTIADLNFKEKKEFGGNTNSAHQDMSQFASTYLKNVMDLGRNNVVMNSGVASDPSSYYNEVDDADDLFNFIDDALSDDSRSDKVNRSSDADKYLEYENAGVVVSVILNDATNEYEYEAVDNQGNIVYDYPLPLKTTMNYNRSTGTATDTYGKKYPLRVV